ncbi:MAG: UDP-N-acetylglucosamine--N-acetylmuramyl-(pentapeptide) pyrophosphoryl-undecaprenol N-acetylglucosamine transferase, partial [Bacteroidetes bacterium]
KAALGFDPKRPLLLVTGGSLGARTLNRAVAAAEALIKAEQVQLLWQCGKLYEAEYQDTSVARLAGVQLMAFVDQMELAYAAADVVIARAGALTIAELCLLGKAAVLVPSPNVAEDHQTQNALALVARNAALLVKDEQAEEEMIAKAIDLLNNSHQRAQLEINAQQLGFSDATARIAEEVLKLAKNE